MRLTDEYPFYCVLEVRKNCHFANKTVRIIRAHKYMPHKIYLFALIRQVRLLCWPSSLFVSDLMK